VVTFYCIGTTLYRTANVVLRKHLSPVSLAPCVLACFAVTDLLESLMENIFEPDERDELWFADAPVWPMALAFGVINGMSMHITKYVTNAVTGNYQKTAMTFGTNLGIAIETAGWRESSLKAGLPLSSAVEYDSSYRMHVLLIFSFLSGVVLSACSFREEILQGVPQHWRDPKRMVLGVQDNVWEMWEFTRVGLVISLLVALHAKAYAEQIRDESVKLEKSSSQRHLSMQLSPQSSSGSLSEGLLDVSTPARTPGRYSNSGNRIGPRSWSTPAVPRVSSLDLITPTLQDPVYD